MKLRELNIKKFRAIDETHLTFEDAFGKIQPVSVLAGPNGCGKTSILFAVIQALRGLMRYRTEDVPEPTDLDVRRGDNGNFITLTPPKISVRLTLEFGEDEKQAIQRVWEDTEPLRRTATEADTAIQGKKFSPEAIKLALWPKGPVVVNWEYPPPLGTDGERRPFWFVESVTPWQAMHWFQGRVYAIRGFRRGLLKEPTLIDRIGGPLIFPQDRSLRARVTGLGAESIDPERELTIWEILKELGQRATSPSLPEQPSAAALKGQAIKSEERIKELFAEICAPKEYVGFAYTPNDPLGSPYFKEGKYHYPLSMASSGEQVILEYIVRLTFPNTLNHGLILIDEPEVHLHAGWVRQLYRALPRLGKDNQFILTTHSGELRSMAAEDRVLIDLGDLQR
jgi:hypothetical protein